MLEAQPLHGVGQLEVNAEVVGVALQLDRGVEPAETRNVQQQPRALPLHLQGPMPVGRRMRLEADRQCGDIVHRARTSAKIPASPASPPLCSIRRADARRYDGPAIVPARSSLGGILRGGIKATVTA